MPSFSATPNMNELSNKRVQHSRTNHLQADRNNTDWQHCTETQCVFFGYEVEWVCVLWTWTANEKATPKHNPRIEFPHPLCGQQAFEYDVRLQQTVNVERIDKIAKRRIPHLTTLVSLCALHSQIATTTTPSATTTFVQNACEIVIKTRYVIISDCAPHLVGCFFMVVITVALSRPTIRVQRRHIVFVCVCVCRAQCCVYLRTSINYSY